jgi:hypothetical protein
MSGKLHTSAVLAPVIAEKLAVWVPELIWAISTREKFLTPFKLNTAVKFYTL